MSGMRTGSVLRFVAKMLVTRLVSRALEYRTRYMACCTKKWMIRAAVLEVPS